MVLFVYASAAAIYTTGLSKLNTCPWDSIPPAMMQPAKQQTQPLQAQQAWLVSSSMKMEPLHGYHACMCMACS
jgi:hypothetical protein